MAKPKTGLMAIIAGPKSANDNGEPEDEDTSDAPLSQKKRALKDMYRAMQSGDWDGAAMAFQDAYDACAMAHEDEGESGTEY